MDIAKLEAKLLDLRSKQKKIDAVWSKAGNRKLIEFFVELLPKALSCERCSIFILDPVDDNVWLHSGTGLKEREIRVPKWSSVVGKVISEGRSIVEEDMENTVGAHDTVDVKTGFVSRNSMCVPVKGVSVDKITGAIQLLNKTGGKSYSDEDKIILKKAAMHLQMNIENIYLRQELIKISVHMDKQIRALEKSLIKRKVG
jgi:hypothetical protein